MANEETNLENRQDHIENTLTDVVRIVGNIERTVIAGFKNQGDRFDRIETEIIGIGMKNDISTLKSDVSGLKTDVSELKYDVGSMKQDIKTDILETKRDIADLRFLIVKVLEKVSD